MRYIYLIKDPISKDIVYVGETSNLKERFNTHIWGNNSFSEEKLNWSNGLKRIGLKPIFEIIDYAENKNEALIKENRFILYYLKKGYKLFNIKYSEVIKQFDLDGNLIAEFANRKIAKELTGILPRKNRIINGGFYWTTGDFNLEKVKWSNTDYKKVKCKKVLQINKMGEIVNEFEGVRIAGKITGIDHRSIAQVASGSKIRKSAGGYKWVYK